MSASDEQERVYISGPITNKDPKKQRANLRRLDREADKIKRQNPDALVYSPGRNRQRWKGWGDWLRHDFMVIKHWATRVHGIPDDPDFPSHGRAVELKYGELLGKEMTYKDPGEQAQRGRAARQRG